MFSAFRVLIFRFRELVVYETSYDEVLKIENMHIHHYVNMPLFQGFVHVCCQMSGNFSVFYKKQMYLICDLYVKFFSGLPANDQTESTLIIFAPRIFIFQIRSFSKFRLCFLHRFQSYRYRIQSVKKVAAVAIVTSCRQILVSVINFVSTISFANKAMTTALFILCAFVLLRSSLFK